jgi:hypothetical protein
MTKLRQILAFMFAILIASPACCCLGASAPEKPAHSCCGDESERPSDKDCDCADNQQIVTEANQSIPRVPVLFLPPTPLNPPSASVDISPAPNLPSWVTVDTGPPRLRLAVYQRFII